ncbi:hypothetical protein SG34_007685 [Thalassomonas viridans]|uniref:Uncharacterized protein n=1 Tax=Thalassomonas viridans TaxID=137584 RepID=A0AAE9Z7L4_9GAMM|nr:hypothetical protein [Thalassomonas viridans]WDE06773.1 hypothetical protein SG34_007685 [Thalassomonas viridans]
MKIKLNKQKIKNLSKDQQALPQEMTPQVAGSGVTRYHRPGPSETANRYYACQC